MDEKKFDQATIETMNPAQLKSELYTALTIIRKTIADVPVTKRKIAKHYNKKGHMRCVNYLRGFLNIWEKKHGT